MDKANWKKELAKIVNDKLMKEEIAHDIYHLFRVKDYALYLGRKEKADLDVLFAAAILHDLFRNKSHHIKRAREFASKTLPKIKFPAEKMKKVDEAIGLHEQMRWQTKNYIKPKFKETFILQDADRIDALGALGLARLFAFAGSRNIPLFDPLLKPKFDNKYEKNERDEVYHIENNIFKRKYNTKIGRKIAKDKIRYMKEFIKKMKEEFYQRGLK